MTAMHTIRNRPARRRPVLFLAAAILVVSLASCSSYKPMEVNSANQGPTKGEPGLISGKDGVFTIFSK